MNRRMQALGRLKTGVMNKTEAQYAELLRLREHAGEVAWWKFEAWKLRLADNTFYMPDFVVMLSGGQLEAHEIKGFMQEDANVKIKVAAATFPLKFLLIRKAKGGAWDIKEIGGE